MKPRKLLIAATVAKTLEAFLLPYAEYFRKQGWEVDAVAEGARSSALCLQAFDNVWEVPWSRNPLAMANWRALKQIRALVEAREYDIVHVHTPIAGFVTRIASRRARRGKTRVVYTAHGFHFHRGGTPWRNFTFRQAEKIAGRWTDRLVVINREDHSAAIKAQVSDESVLRYMPGIGVDIGQYRSALAPCPPLEGGREKVEGPIFLCIAEFIRRKRHADLLHAFARMRNKTAKLLLCGDGPLLESMQALASTLNIAGRTQFLGYRRDVPALLAACNAVVLCSEQEGLPRSIMEAMAAARPVIGTGIRGTLDLLEDGGGRLVPVGGISELADALDWVAEFPDEARRAGEMGAQAVERYAIGAILRMHEELYGELLDA